MPENEPNKEISSEKASADWNAIFADLDSSGVNLDDFGDRVQPMHQDREAPDFLL